MILYMLPYLVIIVACVILIVVTLRVGRERLRKLPSDLAKSHLLASKATAVFIILLISILFISTISVNSFEWGFRYVFFGFGMITTYLKIFLTGSEFVINDRIGNIDIIVGIFLYFLFTYLLYFFTFRLLYKHRIIGKIALVLTTIIVMLTYLFFELYLIGFATI